MEVLKKTNSELYTKTGASARLSSLYYLVVWLRGKDDGKVSAEPNINVVADKADYIVKNSVMIKVPQAKIDV